MCTCNALFKHFTVLSAYCLFYDIQVRPNRSAALHVHVVYLHCASWVICSLPKTLSGQCNLNSRVDQKIKHVHILCMYIVNAHKLFCRLKSECSMPPRRNRIPNEVRRRIVRAFEDPTEDYMYLSVADTLGVNRSTARSIVATYLREGRVNERPRGGRNNVKLIMR